MFWVLFLRFFLFFILFLAFLLFECWQSWLSPSWSLLCAFCLTVLSWSHPMSSPNIGLNMKQVVVSWPAFSLRFLDFFSTSRSVSCRVFALVSSFLRLISISVSRVIVDSVAVSLSLGRIVIVSVGTCSCPLLDVPWRNSGASYFRPQPYTFFPRELAFSKLKQHIFSI